MKRHGGLWPRLTSFENLYLAARKAARGKRRRPNVMRFNHRLESALFRLQRELREGRYRPGEYHTFRIRDPKPRLISAAPYRDRVVHHALCNVLEPIFERTFINESYACRKGRGTHAALDRFSEHARRHHYVLLCDVRRFFPSMDHEVLKGLIARKLKDPAVHGLLDLIIDGSNRQEDVIDWFPGDDLLTPVERRRGLPIGNQTSQFFANVYLDPLDHFVKEQLRIKGYCRYCDDFALFSDDKQALARHREACRDFLAGLRLKLHPRKAEIYRVQDGPRFLGFRIFPTHRRLARENVKRMRTRMRGLQQRYAADEIQLDEVTHSVASWIGHARHGNTWRLRERLFGELPFTRAPVRPERPAGAEELAGRLVDQ